MRDFRLVINDAFISVLKAFKRNFRTPPKAARRKTNRTRPAKTTTKRKPGRVQWATLPAHWFK